jgi:outer membrane protein insertion porin family
VIKTRETNFLSFLGSNDTYDPDRIEADRDILRRFYLKNGYADVQIVAALTEYDPSARVSWSRSRSRKASSIASVLLNSSPASQPSTAIRSAACRASGRSTTRKRLRSRSRKCRSKRRAAVMPSPP